MKRSLLLPLSAALMLTSGCATVTRGTMDGIDVSPEPSGVDVSIVRVDRNGFSQKEIKKNQHIPSNVELLNHPGMKENEVPEAMALTTPSTLTLARRGTYRLTFSKPGYESQTVAVTGVVSGGGSAGMAGNVILGGLIGVGVDASSGAMKDLRPDPVHVILDLIGKGSAAATTAAEVEVAPDVQADASAEEVNAVETGDVEQSR